MILKKDEATYGRSKQYKTGGGILTLKLADGRGHREARQQAQRNKEGNEGLLITQRTDS